MNSEGRKRSIKTEDLLFSDLFSGDATLLAMAHELKSPLCLIRQLSLFLEDAELDSSDAKSYLRQISMVSERGLRLVSDLSRVGNLDQLKFDLEPLSPAEVCRQVAQELSSYYKINQKSLRIETKQRQHYLAMANYDLLKSVLINFCDNALHYASADQPVRLMVSLNKKSQKIRVSVRDYGPRLPIKVWRGLKGRQPLAPLSVSSRPLSSGLGLYLASQFSQAMGAEIGGVAHHDGATFYVDLNISKQLSLL